MKCLLSMLVACAILTPAVSADEKAQMAIHYFVGAWSGDLGGAEYYAKARTTKDGKSVLEKGATLAADGGWCFKTYVLWEPGDRPGTVVMYYYNGNGAHFRTDTVLSRKGEFFELKGKQTGIYGGGEREMADCVLVVSDKDHYTLKFTNRTVEGEDRPDQVYKFTRQLSE